MTAVVVLPTPPFWLATAMMRGAASGRADVPDAEDDGFGVGAAGEAFNGHVPVGSGDGQLGVGVPAFWENGEAIGGEQAVGVADQHVQWRQGARSHQGKGWQLNRLDALGVNGDVFECHDPAGLAKEGTFPMIGFNKMHRPILSCGQDNTGESAASAKVSARPVSLRQ